MLYYVDPGIETQLTPKDPAWVGAWWMSFIVPGTVYLLVSIPFFMFPRQLPSTAAIREERRKEMAQVLSNDLTRDANFKDKIKMLPQHLKLLILSPSFMFLCFAVAALFMFISGVTAFSHKYLQTQFSLTESTASFVVGFHSIAGSGQ